MKNSLISSAALAGLLLILGVAFASEQQPQKSDEEVDEIVAMCEDKYNSEPMGDENERNKLIDECIESNLKAAEKASDDQG